MYPQIGFETQPSYIPNDTIIPTFDDVPDGAVSPPDPTYGAGSWTKLDLQFFASNNMHVDFFINTNNWCGDVTQDSECTDDITQILSLHNPGNHTIFHPHMGTASTTAPPANPDGCNDAAGCEAELTGVESVIATMSKGARPHLTRFRAPYGEPYQAQGAGLSVVEPVVAKYAVEVGWNLDSGDSSGATYTGQQIATNVENLIGSAPGKGTNWGILLQHGTNPWTHDSLPLLFGPKGYLATHGFKLATVEDVICWKFGKHSWEIVQQISGQARNPN
jgi:peptidoglycan/xylan/chitin deacetylase (PgdA/CDA1 family)